MKLNRKGYMLVEIIVAATIAFSIAYYLLNLTYKFKSKSEDLYNQTPIVADKINITKNIMNDLDEGKITSITSSGNNYYYFTITENTTNTYKCLSVIGKTLTYCTVSTANSTNCQADKYQKTLDNTASFGKITNSITNNVGIIKIPLLDSYGNKQEEIKLIIG